VHTLQHYFDTQACKAETIFFALSVDFFLHEFKTFFPRNIGTMVIYQSCNFHQRFNQERNKDFAKGGA